MSQDGESSGEDGGESRADKLRRYGPWVAGGLLVFGGLGSLVTGGGIIRSFLAAIVYLAAAAVALPPTRGLVAEQTGTEFAGWAVAAIVIIGFVAGATIAPPTPNDNDAGLDATPTPNGEATDAETTEATVPPADEGGVGDATPTAGDAATTTAPPPATDAATATAAPTDAPSGIEQLSASSYPDHGMVTGITPDGRYAAFAMHTGKFAAYDAQNDAFREMQGGVDRQPSHILLQDSGRATVAWMDADRFGAVDFVDGDTEWTIEYEGVWDIDPDAEHSRVAAATSPIEGPGGVGVATDDGTMAWTDELDDSAGESVAMTDDGGSVAVGGVQYWSDGGYRGTTGVYLYDGDSGEERWFRETDTDAWDVDVHGEAGLVAAVTDERLIVFDLDGNVVWEQSGGGLWVEISEDGSTVVTTEGGKPTAYDAASGDQRWAADDAPGYISDRLAISADGSRVAAADTGGVAYVADEGNVVWREQYGENPANVDISADGASWSVVVQDNEGDGGLDAYVYRDHDYYRR